MKQFAIALLILIGLAVCSTANAQKVDINFASAYQLTTYTMDGDTTYTFKMNTQYYWTFQFVWAGLDATDGSVSVFVSSDGVNFSSYNLTPLLFNSAGGAGIMRDTDNGTAEGWIQLQVDSGTCTTGTLKVFGNLVSKK